jgi:hypothetical protein
MCMCARIHRYIYMLCIEFLIKTKKKQKKIEPFLLSLFGND